MPSPSSSFPSPPSKVNQKGVAVHKEDDDDNSAYFNSMPPGFRFRPTDDELISCYLEKKLMEEPLPLNRIRDVELYKHNPDYLAEKYQSYGEDEWYFFTPRDRKYKNGQRPKRAAGNGYWKATGADKKIYKNDELVGYRKALVFYEGKAPKGDKSDWIMHEFRVIKSTPCKPIGPSNTMQLDNWVLCKVYKKPEKSEVQDTETQAKDVNKRIRTDHHPDVGDENCMPANTDYNNSSNRTDDSMGLINPSVLNESDHPLQYNLPPLPSEPNQMHPSVLNESDQPLQYNLPPLPPSEPNLPPLPPSEPNQMLIGYQSNNSFGYGDPSNSVLPPPTNFVESNYQQIGYPYNDYLGLKPEDSNVLPQYDFQQENYNMYDFSNRLDPFQNCLDPLNFLSDDVNLPILPNITDISAILKDKLSVTNKNANVENANDKDKSSFTKKNANDKNANDSADGGLKIN